MTYLENILIDIKNGLSYEKIENEYLSFKEMKEKNFYIFSIQSIEYNNMKFFVMLYKNFYNKFKYNRKILLCKLLDFACKQNNMIFTEYLINELNVPLEIYDKHNKQTICPLLTCLIFKYYNLALYLLNEGARLDFYDYYIIKKIYKLNYLDTIEFLEKNNFFNRNNHKKFINKLYNIYVLKNNFGIEKPKKKYYKKYYKKNHNKHHNPELKNYNINTDIEDKNENEEFYDENKTQEFNFNFKNFVKFSFLFSISIGFFVGYYYTSKIYLFNHDEL